MKAAQGTEARGADSGLRIAVVGAPAWLPALRAGAGPALRLCALPAGRGFVARLTDLGAALLLAGGDDAAARRWITAARTNNATRRIPLLAITEEAQQGAAGLFSWFWLPLLPMFVVFFVSALAETNRAPFDLPEAEAELVAGYNVEYSAMTFALFFLGEYANMILMSAIDNLIKGQAGQGVQCLNLMHGLPPETGLPLQSFYP